MRNKRGASNNLTPIVLIVGVVVILYFAGVFDSGTTPSGTGPVSSDLKETVVLSFKDDLATTETTVNAKWYVFDSTGKYVNSGTAGSTTSGEDSVDLGVNSKYTIVAYLDTAHGEYLPKTEEIQTGDGSGTTKTIKLVASSGLKIQDVTNTVDLQRNLTGSAGTTEEMRVIFTANHTNSAVLPGIYFDANDTTIVDEIAATAKTDSAGGTWKSITCPDRLVPTAGNRLWCFERNSRVSSGDGNVIAYFTVTIDGTNAPDDLDFIGVRMMDKFMYLAPGYDSISGIIYDYENAADSDIGEADSDLVSITYEG